MQPENYTASNVARALGVGAWNDSPLKSAREAFRVVLFPAEHAEVCVTAWRDGEAASMRVLSACSPVRRQESPWPVPCDSDEAECTVPGAMFQDLAMTLREAATTPPDGEAKDADLRAYGVLLAGGRRVAGVERPVGSSTLLARFVAALVRTTWDAIDDPGVRDALAGAGSCVGLALPLSTPGNIEAASAPALVADEGPPDEALKFDDLA
jgi:hypothetical protein